MTNPLFAPTSHPTDEAARSLANAVRHRALLDHAAQVEARLASVSYPDCDPQRYGRGGVLRCPHGCVTECARDRGEWEELVREAVAARCAALRLERDAA
jgi:hypothetical protein